MISYEIDFSLVWDYCFALSHRKFAGNICNIEIEYLLGFNFN